VHPEGAWLGLSLTRCGRRRLCASVWVAVAILPPAACATSLPLAWPDERRAWQAEGSPGDLSRLARLPGPASAVAFVPQGFSTPQGRLPYRLLSPAGPERPQARWPLVVVLHGSGALGTDNIAQMDAFARSWADADLAARFPAFVVVPQFAARGADYGPGPDGPRVARPGPALPALVALVDDLCRRLAVDRTRVYVVGFSLGASTSLQALLATPARFAAAVALAPVPPARASAARAVQAPMWLVAGSADTLNPLAASRRWVEAVRAAGGRAHVVTYTGMGHDIPADMIFAEDWRRWLFSQRQADPAPGAPQGAARRR